jgi:hypothetical protein
MKLKFLNQKQNEKRLLDIFADTHMTIDPKFKQNLRQQVTVGKTKRNNGFRWPKLILAPVTMIVILGFAIFASTQEAGAPKRVPFTPTRVSAAELIQKSAATTENVNTDLYSFFTSTYTNHAGPLYDICTNEQKTSAREYSSNLYVYWDKDDSVEAMYINSLEDGIAGRTTAVYDDTPKRVLEEYVIPRGQSLSALLDDNIIGSQPYHYVVDENGNRLSDQKVAPSTINGRQVYAFYVSRNDEKTYPTQCWFDGGSRDIKNTTEPYIPPVEKQDITKYVLDAKTFETIEASQYVESIQEKNLIRRSTYSYTMKKLSSQEALRIMSEAGFDQATARNELSGHD